MSAKNMGWVVMTVSAILILAGSTVNAASIVIDDFTTPAGDQVVSVTGVGNTANVVTALPTANTIGGARVLAITVSTSTFGNVSSANVNHLLGTLSSNNGSGNTDCITVRWDSNGAGLGGVDITLAGLSPYLQAHILASDLGVGFRMDITETLGAGGSTATWTATLGSGAFINQALSSFTNAVNVDFTQVNQMVMTLTGPSAQDCTIGLVEVTSTPVPEPATMTLIGTAVVGLIGWRRRRSMK